MSEQIECPDCDNGRYDNEYIENVTCKTCGKKTLYPVFCPECGKIAGSKKYGDLMYKGYCENQDFEFYIFCRGRKPSKILKFIEDDEEERERRHEEYERRKELGDEEYEREKRRKEKLFGR